MIMKFLKITLMSAMIACALLLAGCTRSGNADEPGSTPAAAGNVTGSAGEGNDKTDIYDTGGAEAVVPVRQRSVTAAPTEYVSDDMYANAAKFANINLSRLEAVMRKAEAGQSITVAVIGGSITQGSSATKPENSYAAIMRRWWEETFPDTGITYVNAGIGGTDSYLGVHRMGPDLLEYKPDFVIVEYSVNDADTNFYKTTYENVVRRILMQENDPAVMLLYMTQDNGTSAQGSHAFVGFYYNLPQLSYHDMIMKELAGGSIVWKDISPDNIHPNDKGHAICGELIWKYLNSVYAGMTDEPADAWSVPSAALTTDAYMNARILDNRLLAADETSGFEAESVAWSEFANGWQTKDGGSITFTVNAKRIGILYYRSVSGTYGRADILIDGTAVRAIDADFSGGWGNSVYAEQVYSGSESGTHTVTVTVPAGSSFDILGILVTE